MAQNNDIDNTRLSTRLYYLTDEDVRALESLIEKHPEIKGILDARSAKKWVWETIKSSAGWMIVVSGAIVLGYDSISKFIINVVGGG